MFDCCIRNSGFPSSPVNQGRILAISTHLDMWALLSSLTSASSEEAPQRPSDADQSAPAAAASREPRRHFPDVTYTRDMEHRLNELERRCNPPQPSAQNCSGNEGEAASAGNSASATASLTPDEAAELADLQKARLNFELVGVEVMRQALAEREQPPSAALNGQGGWDWSSMTSTVSSVATTTFNAGYFWGSLLGTAGPGLVGRSIGLTPNFLHWNEITPLLILGAVPVTTDFFSRGNHLVKLHEQLRASPPPAPEAAVTATGADPPRPSPPPRELGLVVSCMTKEELDGFGLPLGISFAKAADWAKEFGLDPERDVILLQMADGLATASFTDVDQVLSRMHDVMHPGGPTPGETEGTRGASKRVCYVHCKAGKGRSWLTVMCYLTTRMSMSVEEADAFVRCRRPQVNPSATQRQFVVSFTSWKQHGGVTSSPSPSSKAT